MWDEIIPDDQVLLLPVNQLAWFWITLNKAVMNVLEKKMVSSLIKIVPAHTCAAKNGCCSHQFWCCSIIYFRYGRQTQFSPHRETCFQFTNRQTRRVLKVLRSFACGENFSSLLESSRITHVVEMMRVLGRSPCIVGAARRLLWTQIGRAHSLRSHSSEIVAAFHAQIF